MIEIIPAIDIIEGKCVRLSQGDYNQKATYKESPVDMAKRFADIGVCRLHLVDLDGAKSGAPCNLNTLEAIASHSTLDIEWGGGIKTRGALKDVFNAGGNHAIIGSVAVKSPDLMTEWLIEYGGDKIIFGADLRDGKLSVNGWLEDSPLGIDEMIKKFIPARLNQVITTDISKDGMLSGPSTGLYIDLQERYPDITFTVSGGVSSIDDIETLEKEGLRRVIVGKAIYEGKISLEDLTHYIISH